MNKDELEILDVVQRATRFVKGWDTNIERWRALYDMNHYRGSNIGKYNDPTYTNTVDLATGIILGNKLRWHAKGLANSQQETLETSHIEKLLSSLFYINDEREEISNEYEVILNFVRDGGGCLYGVYDPRIAKRSKITESIQDPNNPGTEITQTVYNELPLVAKVVDPLSLILLPGGPKRWLAMGRKESITVLDAESKFGVLLKEYKHLSKEEKLRTKVNLVDLWDYVHVGVPVKDKDGLPVYNKVLGKVETNLEWRIRNTILVDGQAVMGPRIMNGYEDLPFTVQFFKPTGKNPKDWQGIISVLETSISALEKSTNRRSRQIDVYSALPMVSKTQPGRKVHIDSGLYNHVQLGADEDISFPAWPGNAPDVDRHMDFLRSRIQQSGFSDVMFGSGASQITGFALSQLGDQNRIRLTQPIKHLQLMFSHFARKSLKLLETFCEEGSKLRIYGNMRGADFVDLIDISDVSKFMVRAEIVPQYPNEQTRKVAMSTQVKGTLSEQTIMENYLDIDRPDEEFERKIQDAARNHPTMIQYALIAELKEMADGGDDAARITLESMQSDGRGRPEEPNNPEQLTGLAGPDGLPPNQASGGAPPGQSVIEGQENLSSASPNFSGGV
jgi:hypothetical protein